MAVDEIGTLILYFLPDQVVDFYNYLSILCSYKKDKMDCGAYKQIEYYNDGVSGFKEKWWKF